MKAQDYVVLVGLNLGIGLASRELERGISQFLVWALIVCFAFNYGRCRPFRGA